MIKQEASNLDVHVLLESEVSQKDRSPPLSR